MNKKKLIILEKKNLTLNAIIDNLNFSIKNLMSDCY